MKDCIVHHEDWQRVEFVAFINTFLRKKAYHPAPPISEVEGEIAAKINQGRWLVECPTESCGCAVVISITFPLFFCPECANRENDNRWLKIKFPINKEAIEKELLKRPAKDPFRAVNRNWEPGETLAKLRQENKRMGI